MKKIIIACLAFATLLSCTRIDAGHEGILIKQYGSEKGVQDVSLVVGRVFYNPWTEDVEEYATFVQTVDYDKFGVNAKDGSEFIVDPKLSVYIRTGQSPKIFKKYRTKLDEVIKVTLLNYVQDAFRLQMNKYTTEEIVSNRERFESDVQANLSRTLSKEGFVLEQLTSGLKYPKTIVDAVNAKNKMIQEAMGAKNKLVKDSLEAQSKIIKATAEKRANELRNVSLTPLLIQQQFIEKWDGHTPLYGSAPNLLQSIK